MKRFRAAVHGVLGELFDGELPETGRQPDATAVSMALAVALARETKRRGLTLIGAPHSPKTKRHAKRIGLDYVHREHLVDFVVVRRLRGLVELPVVACESEVHASHGVDYGFDFWPSTGRRFPMNGFVWDFRKLLLVRSPRLLFVARVNQQRSSGDSRIATLERTLTRCAADHGSLWSGARLDVLLMPGGRRERELARVGTAVDGAPLKFEPLFA